MLTLAVWVDGTRVGELIQENYEYTFQYNNIQSLDPERDLVSLTMPIRAKRYDTQVLMPPFQTSLPGGALLENLRTKFNKVLDISNDIVLLQLVGNNTIGRVRFTPVDESLGTLKSSEYSLKELLTHPETEALFIELLDQFSEQSGISGVQPKVLWSQEGQKVALLRDNYILKAAGSDYFGLAVNEFFCLEAAKAAGLQTPEYSLAESGELLAVKRFDVREEGQQLAFEEVCALLGRPNNAKYTGSYEEVVDLIQKVPCEPTAESNRQIYKSIILNMLIKNGNAHLKNFGVLYDDTNHKWLAPFYDIVNTTIYIPKDLPALTIGGKLQWPDITVLRKFGWGSCGLRKKEVEQCIEETIAGIESTIPRIESYSSKNETFGILCEKLSCIFKAAKLVAN